MTSLDPWFIGAFAVMVYVGLPVEYARWKWQKAKRDNILALCFCFICYILVVGWLIYGDLIPTSFGQRAFMAVTAGIGSFFFIAILWEVFLSKNKAEN